MKRLINVEEEKAPWRRWLVGDLALGRLSQKKSTVDVHVVLRSADWTHEPQEEIFERTEAVVVNFLFV